MDLIELYGYRIQIQNLIKHKHDSLQAKKVDSYSSIKFFSAEDEGEKED